MTDENPQVTIDFKKWGIILGVVASLGGMIGASASQFGSYHSKYATVEVVEDRMDEISKEIIVLALQSKEDELLLIQFKEQNDEATNFDLANKETIIRRMADLKKKLDRLEED